MKLYMRMVVVAAVMVVLINMNSSETCRVLNTDFLQKSTVNNPPQIPSMMKEVVQRRRNYETIYIPSIIRQRLQKGTVPSGGNPGTNIP